MSKKVKRDVEEEEEEDDDDWQFCKYCNTKFDNQVKYNAHIRSMTHTQNVMMWDADKEKKFQMTKSSTGTQKKDTGQEKKKTDVQKKDNIHEQKKVEPQKKDDNQEKNKQDSQKSDSQGTEESVPSNSTGTKRKIESPYFCKACDVQLAGRQGFNLHVQTPKHILAVERQKGSSKEDSEDGPAEKKLKTSSAADDAKEEFV